MQTFVLQAWKGSFQLWQMNETLAAKGEQKSAWAFGDVYFENLSIRTLAEYLASDRAHWLEQEDLDPVSP